MISLSWDLERHKPIEGIAWVIDKDYLNEGDPQWVQYNKEGVGRNKGRLNEYNRVRFRTYGDDGNIYYEGWLLDDVNADSQQDVYEFAMMDAGATDVRVLRNGYWVLEIG